MAKARRLQEQRKVKPKAITDRQLRKDYLVFLQSERCAQLDSLLKTSRKRRVVQRVKPTVVDRRQQRKELRAFMKSERTSEMYSWLDAPLPPLRRSRRPLIRSDKER